jgi:sugar phosphate isomerase/epimerase
LQCSDARSRREIVREVNRKDLGVVIDSFHFYAGNSTFEMIEALDPDLIQIFHINDAEDLPRTVGRSSPAAAGTRDSAATER